MTKDLAQLEALCVELNKTVKQFEARSQMEAEFIATVSHELRTPLAMIKESAAVMLEGIAGSINEKQKRLLNISRNNVDRMTRLVDDLLDLAKLEAHKVELRREHLDICKMAHGMVDQMRLKTSRQGVDLAVTCCPKKPVPVFADPDRLEQIFTNLMANSIKFTQRGGKVSVEIMDHGELVEISMLDTGKGIAKSDMPKLFSKFQQFDSAKSTKAKGTGLGLVITKGLVELHGGKIWAESPPSGRAGEHGRGAKFTFTLPKRPN